MLWKLQQRRRPVQCTRTLYFGGLVEERRVHSRNDSGTCPFRTPPFPLRLAADRRIQYDNASCLVVFTTVGEETVGWGFSPHVCATLSIHGDVTDCELSLVVLFKIQICGGGFGFVSTTSFSTHEECGWGAILSHCLHSLSPQSLPY